ncbi:nuclear transport factor 2 family protein [Polynucleobacter sp. IMCC30063]|uniref:nuclear transport factor 2 family protein n=1 Tax=unclassified Polynucleobacter TaxID=2640945 RepID=UPI001F4007AB|nr:MULTISPECIES: nuclear transport factor 2 family protein [unclassified Polynucleobacter]MCE7506886.1 nuclear transport factor 2 family protein [Polynucleobacter sp. IMCC30063]MCE7527403.1 nuclear transport factor 2 family protein [Polynucleobacter sp. IMCC 30228]MCE7528732.1 nuclear transport factor 2 family protein [Polynucleobacter sp. IMCC 29146]
MAKILFNRALILIAILMSLMAVPMLGQAQVITAANAQVEAEKLERLWWDQVKNGDMQGLEKTVSPNYQQVLNIGAQNKAAWMEIIKKAKIREYALSSLKATYSENALIVSYAIATKEIIDGKELSRKPQYRLDVWQKSAAGWQVIAHANLNPVP